MRYLITRPSDELSRRIQVSVIEQLLFQKFPTQFHILKMTPRSPPPSPFPTKKLAYTMTILESLIALPMQISGGPTMAWPRTPESKRNERKDAFLDL
jgi:hypothetical protein